jgi:hypothetical protein
MTHTTAIPIQPALTREVRELILELASKAQRGTDAWLS